MNRYAHMTMHTSWLWWAHKFHHKFSSAVTPCVAMAVWSVTLVSCFAQIQQSTHICGDCVRTRTRK